uniref:Uncharacterized protein n=1 Tax=Romanomermis culicivorax TaxID=13658 RepID=A0A915KI64_ROMCU
MNSGVAKQAFRTLEEVKTAVKGLKQLCHALSFLLQINHGRIDIISDENKDRNVRVYEQLCQDTPKWKKFNRLLNYS